MDADRKATLTGVAISLGGNVLISLALNVQKLAHKRLAAAAMSSSSPVDKADGNPAGVAAGRRLSPSGVPQRAPNEATPLLADGDDGSGSGRDLEANADDSDDAFTEEGNFLASPLWWSGLLLLSMGELCNFAAYGFSPASVVAPLGTAALVANWAFAPLILGERFRSQDTLGVGLAIIGASTIVLSARTTQPALDPPALIRALSQVAFIVYSSTVAVCTVVLAVLAESGYDSRHLLVDIVLCALLGGFTVLSTKAVSSLFNSLVWNAFREPVFYASLGILIFTALGQLRYLNRALQRFSSKHVVPAQFACFTLSVLLGSSVLYRDFDDVSPQRFMTFVLGLSTTLVGVALLAPEGGATDEADETDINGGANGKASTTSTAAVEADDDEAQSVQKGAPDSSSTSASGWPAPSVDLSSSPPRQSSSTTAATVAGRGRSPSSAISRRSPLLPTIRLESPSRPPPTQGSRAGAAALAIAHSSGQQQQKPRLRRSSTASVRALSAGGILLSSSLGTSGGSGVALVRASGGQPGMAVVVPPPGQLAPAVEESRPNLAE